MNIPTKSQRGFTLLELLVVISIIGLFTSVALASLQSAREKARDAQRFSDIREIQRALEMAKNDTGSYPTSAHWDCSYESMWQDTGSGTFIGTVLAPYFRETPTDPTNEEDFATNGALTYCYWSRGTGGGSYYVLAFSLETPKASLDTFNVRDCSGIGYNSSGDGVTLIRGESC